MDLFGLHVDYRFRDRIPQVREVFRKLIDDLDDLQCLYQEDIEKTMTNNYWVEKFLEWYKGNIDKTAEGLLFSAKYIKEYHLRDFKFHHIFSEIYSVGTIFKYEPDRLGRPTIYFRSRFSPSCKETRQMSLQLGCFMQLWMEEISREDGYICINDFAGMTMANVDFGIHKETMNMMRMLPLSMKLIIFVNVPFALRWVINSLKLFLPAEHKKGFLILSQEQLQEVIPIENIPDFLGGTCKKPYSGQEMVPKGALPIKEFFKQLAEEQDEINQNGNGIKSPVKLKLDKESVPKVVDYYEKLVSV